MDWIDTNLLISICTFAIALTQFLFWRYIAKQKSYEIEKGRNLATKEDIAEITEKIESVKESYNKSLEKHKIELQKEFESYRYIIALCNSIDKELLIRLIKCKNEIESDLKKFIESENIGLCQNSINNLCDYLKSFNVRYNENENTQFILQIYRKIERLNAYEENGEDSFNYPEFASNIQIMVQYINKLIAQFLPKFK